MSNSKLLSDLERVLPSQHQVCQLACVAGALFLAILATYKLTAMC